MRIVNDHLHCALLKIISGTLFRRREVLNGVWNNKKTLVISFDCDYGQDMLSYEKILSILGKEGVLASFALTGMLAQEFPKVVDSILHDGHEVINHTYTHPPNFRELPISKKFEEVSLFQDLMKDVFGIIVKGFRAPHLLWHKQKDLFNVLTCLSLFDSSLIGYGVQEVEGVIEIPLTPFPDVKNLPFCTYHHFRMPLISSSQHSFMKRWKMLLSQQNFINIYLDPIDFAVSDQLLNDLISLAFEYDFSFSTLQDVSKRLL